MFLLVHHFHNIIHLSFYRPIVKFRHVYWSIPVWRLACSGIHNSRHLGSKHFCRGEWPKFHHEPQQSKKPKDPPRSPNSPPWYGPQHYQRTRGTQFTEREPSKQKQLSLLLLLLYGSFGPCWSPWSQQWWRWWCCGAQVPLEDFRCGAFGQC